jgi:hypothetical protein
MQSAENNILVIKTGSLVTRPIVAVIGMTALFCMSFTIYITTKASNLEFRYSVTNRDSKYPPPLVENYRDIYLYGKYIPIISFFGICIMLYHNTCKVIYLIIYIAILTAITMMWLIITLFMFYLANQIFWIS